MHANSWAHSSPDSAVETAAQSRPRRFREIGTSISEASKRVPIFLHDGRGASKRVPVFDRGTSSKSTESRTGSDQAPADWLESHIESDYVYKVIVLRPSVRKLHDFPLSDSQFPLASSSLSIEVGHTHEVGRTQWEE